MKTKGIEVLQKVKEYGLIQFRLSSVLITKLHKTH